MRWIATWHCSACAALPRSRRTSFAGSVPNRHSAATLPDRRVAKASTPWSSVGSSSKVEGRSGEERNGKIRWCCHRSRTQRTDARGLSGSGRSKNSGLERNPHIGGGCTTEEPALAGYRFNLHSNFFMGFRHSPLIHDLELYRFGFSYIEPPIQQGAAFRDGTCVVIHKDLDKTCASLARFSAGDAEMFRELHFLYAVKMRPLFTSIAFNAPLPIDQLKDRLSGAQAKEFLSHAEHDLFSVVRKHFEDDRIRTLFTSYMHVITTESVPGAGIVFPLIFANVMEFTLPVGGSASFTDALARVIVACGGSVITGADVKEVVVRNGRATAVRLANGGAVEGSRFIASAIDAPATMRMAKTSS